MASSSDTPPPSLSKVSRDTIEKAVEALLKWKDNQSNSQKPQLLPQDDFITLILTLKKIPPNGGRINPHKLPLPHPLHSSSELCLIIDDRPFSKLTSDSAKQKIKLENIPISKVLKLSKLRSDYRPFEAKRKLCDSYDMFFADKRVVPLLPKLLGKEFFKKKKLPVTVDLTHKNWKEQIEKGSSSALLYMRAGTCSVVRVGKISMERGEIVENVVAAVNGFVEVVPKKWEGVRSLHLKFSESLALPIYQVLPDMKLKIKGIRENVEEVKEEGGSELVVKEEGTKDGKLHKKKGSKKGRIHEVRYMDELVVEDDDDNEDNKNQEDDDLGSGTFVGKKRKKGDFGKGRVRSELNGEKPVKKKGKVGKGGSGGGEGDNDNKRSENDDLGSAGFEGKKKRKGDSMKGQEVLSEKKSEKRAKKMSKNGDDDEQKNGGLALKGTETSSGKKGKKKSDFVTASNNAVKEVKVKRSKKHSAE